MPYFRPFANATRGQLAKIVANAAGLEGAPTGVFYADVQEDHTFYVWTMRLTEIGAMSGYRGGKVSHATIRIAPTSAPSTTSHVARHRR